LILQHQEIKRSQVATLSPLNQLLICVRGFQNRALALPDITGCPPQREPIAPYERDRGKKFPIH
jgi:hypothetical protein